MFANADDAFSIRFGGGLEFFFNHDIALSTEILYVSSGDDTADSWQLRTGIKNYF
jgi:hypothetical protein